MTRPLIASPFVTHALQLHLPSPHSPAHTPTCPRVRLQPHIVARAAKTLTWLAEGQGYSPGGCDGALLLRASRKVMPTTEEAPEVAVTVAAAGRESGLLAGLAFAADSAAVLSL